MPGNGRDRLNQAALDLDFQKIARLVREGHRSDEAFLSDQGQTLDPDDQEENKAIVERVSAELGVHVENEDQLLMEVYSTLIQAGHPPPDGPVRRCVARVLGSATGDRCERAAVLMGLCLDAGMLDWRTSKWAAQASKERKKDQEAGRMGLPTPLAQPYELYSDAVAKAAEAGNMATLKVLARALPEDIQERKQMLCTMNMPAHRAVRGGQIPCLEFLFDIMPREEWLSATIGDQVSLPAVAAANGHEAMLRWLVGNGFEINTHNKGVMKNILSVALDNRQPAMIPVLLELGADPCDIPDDSPGPLHVAAWRGFGEAAGHLLRAGASVELRAGGIAMTPLLMAAMVGNAEVVQALIEHGAGIEDRDRDGQTAAHWAARNDRAQALVVLAGAGADMDARRNDGATPRQIAKGGAIEVLARLQSESMNAQVAGAGQPTGRARRI